MEDSSQCVSDVLSIYDGATQSDRLIGSFCGSNVPPDLRSTGQSLTVAFNSNAVLEYRGFKITYTYEAQQQTIPGFFIVFSLYYSLLFYFNVISQQHGLRINVVDGRI